MRISSFARTQLHIHCGRCWNSFEWMARWWIIKTGIKFNLYTFEYPYKINANTEKLWGCFCSPWPLWHLKINIHHTVYPVCVCLFSVDFVLLLLLLILLELPISPLYLCTMTFSIFHFFLCILIRSTIQWNIWSGNKKKKNLWMAQPYTFIPALCLSLSLFELLLISAVYLFGEMEKNNNNNDKIE